MTDKAYKKRRTEYHEAFNSANEKEIILRPYMIAKRMGCKFYFGSDAHHPDELDAAKGIFERAIDDLKLEEGDGFTLKRG